MNITSIFDEGQILKIVDSLRQRGQEEVKTIKEGERNAILDKIDREW